MSYPLLFWLPSLPSPTNRCARSFSVSPYTGLAQSLPRHLISVSSRHPKPFLNIVVFSHGPSFCIIFVVPIHLFAAYAKIEFRFPLKLRPRRCPVILQRQVARRFPSCVCVAFKYLTTRRIDNPDRPMSLSMTFNLRFTECTRTAATKGSILFRYQST